MEFWCRFGGVPGKNDDVEDSESPEERDVGDDGGD